MSDNPFWDFSLDLYGRPEVATACLALQDEAGADVNIVLYLLWCASTGRPLDARGIAATDAALADWRRRVVEPLRGIRRAMKAGLLAPLDTEMLRGRVKSVELEAERLAQDALLAIAPASSGPPTAAAPADAYLAIYAAGLGRPLPDAALRTLAAAVAP